MTTLFRHQGNSHQEAAAGSGLLPCACLSRRRFLAGCAACAAGLAGPAAFAGAAPAARKVRVRLMFAHTTPDKIAWPNIGYDYERRGRELLAALRSRCPEIEFLPAHATDEAQARAVLAAGGEVDAHLLYLLSTRSPARILTEELGRAGRPMLMVEDQFAGSSSLGFNGRAEAGGWKAVGIATSRMDDIAEMACCFQVLGRPGATADAFLAAAKGAYRKCIASVGRFALEPDNLTVGSVGECIRRMKSSRILLVARNEDKNPKVGRITQGIEESFGTKVIAIQPGDLHQLYLKADRDQAAQLADRWCRTAARVIEPTREEIVKSGAMHLAMQALMKHHDANAITIACLGGFYSGQLQAFPCLGFAELNDTGLVGACEGDLSSTITMLAMGHLIGRPGFISDPVIDLGTNRIIYAHCVAPTRVFGPAGPANPFHIRDHSEDRKGAAIRSLLPLGFLTSSMKFVPERKQLIFHQARAVENVDEDKACRTKLAAEVKGDIDKLFSGWAAGWHRVTFYGDLREPARELCRALKFELVEEA